MKLDLKRNNLLTYNMLMAILGVCFGFGGMIGGFFGAVFVVFFSPGGDQAKEPRIEVHMLTKWLCPGMNLDSSVQEEPTRFFHGVIASTCIVEILLTLLGVWFLWSRNVFFL
jgi:hypothetical protein